jgi:hypothetical protein
VKPITAGGQGCASFSAAHAVRRQGNVLINPLHPEFSAITAARPEPVVWDARLFGRR